MGGKRHRSWCLQALVVTTLAACTTGTLNEEKGDFQNLLTDLDTGPVSNGDSLDDPGDAGSLLQPDGAAATFCPRSEEDCDVVPACASLVVSNCQCRVVPLSLCIHNDGCCPNGCSANDDNDCSTSCGNGVLEGGELCEGVSCPSSCNDNNACTHDRLRGSASTCDASCTYVTVEVCRNDDGCCPAGCTANDDNDCSATCGNGAVEEGEACDPKGSCPTSCNDGNACTSDVLTGSADNCSAACSHTEITQCIGGDGCCPGGCSFDQDDDCPPPPPPSNPDCTDAANWPWRSIEAEVFTLVNMVRTSGATCGTTQMPPVGTLKRNAALDQASRCHSADMAAQDYVSHTSLDGRSPWIRMAEAGYTGSPTGENIAAGQRSAASVMDSWMKSEGHCKNIMSAGANEVGIGAVFEWDAQSIAPLWTQGFGQR